MACFLIPMTEAIVTTIAQKVIEKNEKKTGVQKVTSEDGYELEKTPFSKKLGWLNKLLWGGSALLAFEHLWHGEVVPFFPFLTAAQEGPEAVSEMLHEMSTVGVSMAVLITVVWGAMLLISKLLEKRALKAIPAAK